MKTKGKLIRSLFLITVASVCVCSGASVTGDPLIIGSGHSSVSSSSSIAGGQNNTNVPIWATIAGGRGNTIATESYASFIGAGTDNIIHEDVFGSAIVAGIGNQILEDGYQSTIAGGYLHLIGNSPYSFIGGGYTNIIREGANYSFIGGGRVNTISTNCQNSAISGGNLNSIRAGSYTCTIGGGQEHVISENSPFSTITGGGANQILRDSANSTIGGGGDNVIRTNSILATIAGGIYNSIGPSAALATVSGGYQNTASADYATVPGGKWNVASGRYSLAAGYRAHALHDGSFVWGDSASESAVSSSSSNQFIARASGGVTFYSNSGLTTGVNLASGGGSWSSLSDRNVKENFADVNPREILDRLASVPMQTWNYKSQVSTIRHIGPMAQDFYAAFEVGEDDKRITGIDADGVALAAIQGLHEVVREKESQIAALQNEIERMQKQAAEQQKAMDQWSARLTGLERRLGGKNDSAAAPVSGIRQE